MNRRYLAPLAFALWILTVGSCAVAGIHRGTTEDPDNVAAIQMFYCAALTACILTVILWITRKRKT